MSHSGSSILSIILTCLSCQVLAVFMAVPPLIEVSHSAPDLWRWFINLPWVRFITRRPAPRVPSPEEMGTPDAEFIDWQNNEKKGTVDSQSSFMTEQPRLGKTHDPNHSKGATEYGQSHVPSNFPLHARHASRNLLVPLRSSRNGSLLLPPSICFVSFTLI